MRKITIVGAGQAGLVLGTGLRKNGYDVTIVTNRTGEEVHSGSILSGQGMFNETLDIERELGMNHWDNEYPKLNGIQFSVADGTSNKAISWSSKFTKGHANSIDQRLKMPIWMDEFEKIGGRLLIKDVTLADLDAFAAESDLVLVASGKGDIVKMFERDSNKSTFDKPMRGLAMAYVKNPETANQDFVGLRFNLVPGVGEAVFLPALTTSGLCDIFSFEAIPGGDMDRFNGKITDPEEHLGVMLSVLKKHLPWEAERYENAELVDKNATLAGRFPPTIRKPIGTLPSGAIVMGLADAVCLNDPLTGQGSNNATVAAKVYLDRILAHEDREFDANWMQGTFDKFWEYAKYVVEWTNMFLLPPPPHLLAIISAAESNPKIAARIADGFSNPKNFFPWFMEEEAAEDYIKSFK